jgi:hypothetical protein
MGASSQPVIGRFFTTYRAENSMSKRMTLTSTTLVILLASSAGALAAGSGSGAGAGGGGAAAGGGGGAMTAPSTSGDMAASGTMAHKPTAHKSSSKMHKTTKPMNDQTNMPGADASSDTKGK